MPAELLLRCTCSATRPGDRLVAVGGHPALGSWEPARSRAVLQTGPESFPCWESPAPVVLEEGPITACVVEYKYVILDAQNCARWEDLNDDSASDIGKDVDVGYDIGFGDGELEARSPEPEIAPLGKVLNRRLVLFGDAVAYRAEHFGQADPSVAASWPVRPDWAPGLAGGCVTLGHGKRSSESPLCELQYRFPRQIFVQPRRARLLATLEDLRCQLRLPRDLWPHILGFVASDLA